MNKNNSPPVDDNRREHRQFDPAEALRYRAEASSRLRASRPVAFFIAEDRRVDTGSAAACRAGEES